MRKTPVTLGVLSMVFGGLVAAYSAAGIALSSFSGTFLGNLGALARRAPQRPGEPDPAVLFSRIGEMTRELAPYNNALLAGKVLFSLALVAIGYGLYKRQRWGRSGALAWSVLALLYLGAELIVRIGVIQPRMDEMLRHLFSSMPDGALDAAKVQALGNTQGAVAVIMSLVFYAPFPILLLALCGRRSAAADFID